MNPYRQIKIRCFQQKKIGHIIYETLYMNLKVTLKHKSRADMKHKEKTEKIL